ncbi:toll/interleukin-1 receptor domain-containing protein [Actinokineospora fastidiosa]|uniref:TIR domain-containing protein n=1 Tax=Actinokineospora fastidiosa TaxID=1816 RepID=A0A918GLP7_9PSEU|nr:toll/interleukin-1 receptor domain-containing protein [Actinokineospora fastidiosa]GGS46497.1 hypothetical protein GCM10010171_47130 [Actinokineospora fastidiosa]
MTEVATYDVAVSFAEEQREAVDEVVEAFRQRGLTVLHGPDQIHDWWARKDRGDLPVARVRFFLPFVSAVDEFTAAMLRAVKAGDQHVLPVLVGPVAVPEELLHPHVDYLRASTPDRLTDAVSGRVEAAEAAGRDRAPVAEVVTTARAAAPAPSVPATFSRYAEQDAALRYLGEQFAAALPGLAGRGLVGTAHIGDSRIAVRVERAGDTVYALDIQRGGIGGDETVNFVVGRHDPGSACSNGWARPVHDTATGATGFELHDLSLLGRAAEPRTYSREELFTALWERITAVLASTLR